MDDKTIASEKCDELVKMSVFQKDLIRRYIGDMMGLKAIGKEIHSDPRTFKKEFTSLGIEIPFPGSVWKKMQDHYSGRFDRSISPFLEEIITGSLLGDGNIRLQSKVDHHEKNPSLDEYRELLLDIGEIRQRVKNGDGLTRDDIERWNHGIEIIRNTNTAHFRIHKSIVEIRWVKKMMEIFDREIDVQSKFIKTIRDAKNIAWTCGFDTLSSVQLFNIWKDWYTKDGQIVVKRVPRHILTKITLDSLLQWYTGDGFYSGKTIGLCTSGFSKSDQLYLIKLLAQIDVDSHFARSHTGGEITISHKKEKREYFINMLTKTKQYLLAEREFPQKFDGNYSKKDLMMKLRLSYPEFFDSSNKPRWDDY